MAEKLRALAGAISLESILFVSRREGGGSYPQCQALRGGRAGGGSSAPVYCPWVDTDRSKMIGVWFSFLLFVGIEEGRGGGGGMKEKGDGITAGNKNFTFLSTPDSEPVWPSGKALGW